MNEKHKLFPIHAFEFGMYELDREGETYGLRAENKGTMWPADENT